MKGAEMTQVSPKWITSRLFWVTEPTLTLHKLPGPQQHGHNCERGPVARSAPVHDFQSCRRSNITAIQRRAVWLPILFAINRCRGQ
jgi:hypothetical protein